MDWRAEMGFLDKIRSFVESGELDKITEKVGKTVNTLIDEQRNTAQSAPRAAAQSPSAAQVSPAKASRNVTFEFCDGEDAEIDVEASFMLSGYFVESDSGAGEVDYCAVYAPECTDDYAEYDGSKPVFAVMNAAEREIYDLIENYKKGITDSSCSITKVSLPYSRIYFKAKLNHRGIITYFYALDRGRIWKNCYIGVNYPTSLAGTALESKIIAAVDEAAATYRETIK